MAAAILATQEVLDFALTVSPSLHALAAQPQGLIHAITAIQRLPTATSPFRIALNGAADAQAMQQAIASAQWTSMAAPHRLNIEALGACDVALSP